MEITVKQAQGRVPITIVETHGDLDASNYEMLITTVQELHAGGVRDVLLDMSDTEFMASSGLVALHSIAMLLRGEALPDPEAGWDAFHAIDRDRDSGFQQHVKLFKPQPQVARVLEMTGLNQFFVIHTDLAAAVASF